MNRGYDFELFTKYLSIVQLLNTTHRTQYCIADIVSEEDYEKVKHFPLGKTPSFMAEKDVEYLVAEKQIPIAGKNVLDIGFGDGEFMNVLAEQGANVFGFDIDKPVNADLISGTIFTMPVEKMPKELWGTFDTAINFRAMDLSNFGFTNTTFDSVTRACVRALKKSGIYVGTLIDEQVIFKGGKPIVTPDGRPFVNALRKYFKTLELEKALHGPNNKTAMFIAQEPREQFLFSK